MIELMCVHVQSERSGGEREDEEKGESEGEKPRGARRANHKMRGNDIKAVLTCLKEHSLSCHSPCIVQLRRREEGRD